MDFNQLIYEIPNSGDSREMYAEGFRYLFIDGDGTWHHFKSTNTSNPTADCLDEDGLSFTIKHVSGNIEIVDKHGNKSVFDKKVSVDPLKSCYVLIYSQDLNGNKITYCYDEQPDTSSSKIGRIEEDAGRATQIGYDQSEHKKVTKITLADHQAGNPREVNFTYDGEKLKEITYPDGLKTGYVYDKQGRLSGVWTDAGVGSSVGYEYASNDYESLNFFKIRSVTEYAGTKFDPKRKGRSTEFYYEMNQTKITNKINNLDVPYREDTEVWQFDHEGRTTCVIDADGNFHEREYFKKETETPKTKHRVKETSRGQKIIHNLLKNSYANSSAQQGLENWNTNHLPSENCCGISVSSDCANLGEKSFKVLNSANHDSWPIAKQKISIPVSNQSRKYTFSGDIKINSALEGGDGASLCLASFKDKAQTAGDEFSEWISDTDNSWRRLSVTIDVPAGSDEIRCYFGMKNSSGTAYFDCLQLEESDNANEYNMIESSDFKGNNDVWIQSNLSSDDVITEHGMRIIGNPGTAKNICQRIDIKKTNPVFNIAVRAKADSLPKTNMVDSIKSGFYVAFEINYSDGTAPKRVDEYFNQSIGSDQYYFNSILSQDYTSSDLNTPDKIVDYVRLFLCYNYNCNEAYFEEVQVTVADGVNCYHYDENAEI